MLFPLLSYGTEVDPKENSQIGRYQLVSNGSTGILYLLDTTSGHVWSSQWSLQYSHWHLQAPMGPDQLTN